MVDFFCSLSSNMPLEHLKDIPKKIKTELLSLGKFSCEDGIDIDSVNANLESLLEQRINKGNYQFAFALGQINFEKKCYLKSWNCFLIAFNIYNDKRAQYQIAVMLYDNLISSEISGIENPKEKAHKMFEEITHLDTGPESPIGQRELVFYAAYNLGRSFYQRTESHSLNERSLNLFLFAADDGNPKASILAQTALGYLYSGAKHYDLKKSFYWHSEACGNGSVESQAAIGVMYLYGIGVKQNWTNALFCLSEASTKGNLYAKANLIYLYYQRKMFTNVCYLSSKIATSDYNKDLCVTDAGLQSFYCRAMAMICFLYALCLRNGTGVQVDETLASTLFSKSIEYDSALAMRYHRMVISEEL